MSIRETSHKLHNALWRGVAVIYHRRFSLSPSPPPQSRQADPPLLAGRYLRGLNISLIIVIDIYMYGGSPYFYTILATAQGFN